MKQIDARGLACPAPVLQTKAAIERDNPDTIGVVVDNEAAKQNVGRFLNSQGFSISVEQRGSDYLVIGAREEGSQPVRESVEMSDANDKKTMVLITTDRMGSGDDELGRQLLINFIKTLKEMGTELWRLVLVNNGVKLTIAGSEVLSVLKEYERDGLQILVCGTCLNHFDLMDRKCVGETTNMLDVVTAMQYADKVITI